MSTPPKDRRTMPPLPAAGVHPMAHNESSAQNDSEQDKSTVPPRSGTGPEANANPKSNPINMALFELQGDMDQTESPVPPTEPARPASEKPEEVVPPPPQPVGSPAAESQLAPTPVEPPVATEGSPLPAPGSREAALEKSAVEPSPAPPSGSLSSTPPLAGPLERPSQRPPTAEPPAPQTAAENAPPLATVLVAAAVVSLLFGLLGAWAYDHFFRDGKPPAEPAVASSTGASEVPPPSPSAAELEPLKTRLGELGEEVDEFEKHLDEASSKPSATTDLTPIRQQIDGVAKAIAAIDPLSKRLDGISARMEGLETSVNGLKGDLGSLKTKAAEPEKRNATPSSTPTSSTPTAVPPVVEPGEPAPLAIENVDLNLGDKALSEGIELFKLGKYQQANEFFDKLVKTNENDARVWYYAALSRGLATGDWGEATTNLAKKGVEREKAGTPKSSEIDAMFRDLNSGTGKEWLDFKRKNAVK